MRLIRRLQQEESGVALVMALMTAGVLTVTVSALLLSSAANQSSQFRSADARKAFQIAQAALAYAEGTVYLAAKNHTTPTGDCATNPLPAQPGGGSGCYWAVLEGDGVTWTMYGTGTFGAVSRTVSAQANVPSPVTLPEGGVWNYVYADGAGATCTTLNGSVTVSIPIMVRGNLCLGGHLNFKGSRLEVGGDLSVGGSAAIGAANAKVSQIRVGLTPDSTNTCQSVTPGTGVCDGSHSPIYASSIAEGMDVTPQMPCIGQPSSYDPQCTAADGTDGTWKTLHTQYDTQAGLAKSGCPANLFDNDSTLNNSDTSISTVMFGSTAYDCTVGSNEIKWTPSTHALYVHGVLYMDGSLTLSGNVTYSGQASMYFTGGISTNGSPTFCGASGIFGGSSCTTHWNPDADGIIFVAGCWADSTGSTLITSSCVNLAGGANVQFGVYCTTQYTTSGGSSNMGPVLANSINLGGGTQTLMPFHEFPPGTPLTPSYLPASKPTHWSG